MRVLFFLPILLLGAVITQSAPISLFQDAKPQAKIYLSSSDEMAAENPKAGRSTLGAAVDDLNYHFKRMAGSALEVVRTDSLDDIRGPAIVLGTLAQKNGLEVSSTPFQNSVRLRTEGERILIGGEKPSATANGIYIFLNRLGCEWVLPGKIGEIIPLQATINVSDFDVRETPSFAGRNLWYRAPRQLCTPQDTEEFALWRARQRLDAPGETPDLGAGHFWGGLIRRHQAAFDADPTMLALVREKDGTMVRKGPQIESTNEKVIELFVKDIRDKFAKERWSNDKVVSFGIGPADGLDFSESPETVLAGGGGIDPLTGFPDMTDICVLLGNEILKRIEGEYPNVSLGYYAYSVHGDYPRKYKPHPRLNQIFAPINFSRFHSPLAMNSKTWPYYVEIVEKWSALSREQGNQLSYRGYNWNLAENMIPYSKLQIYGEEIPWYHAKGFSAVNIEATKAWAVNGPSDFLLAKLLWNSAQDWRTVLRDYCEKSFGAGAPEMEAYFLNLTSRQNDAGQEAGSYHAIHLMYDEDFVKQSRLRIETAIRMAALPEEKTRAGYFLYPLEQLEAFLKFRAAFTQCDFAVAARYYAEIGALWKKAYAENTQLVAAEVPRYLERYFQKFVEMGQLYSSGSYRLVLALPDELTTQFDPAGEGDRLGFQNPRLNDSLFLKSRTWSAPWDAQGLGAMRKGAVWYRFPFELPAHLGHEGLGLFIGGVEDQVSVWLNGKSVGHSPRGFSVPFVFDLTEAFDPIGKNVLVMKVTRLSAINEIGLGGIIRPAFLFKGPRLPESVSATGSEERVLPGGESEKK